MLSVHNMPIPPPSFILLTSSITYHFTPEYFFHCFHYLQIPPQHFELMPLTITYCFHCLQIPHRQVYMSFPLLAVSSSTLSLAVSSTSTFPSASLTSCFWYMHIPSGQLHLLFPLLAHSHVTASLTVSGTCTFIRDKFI